MRESKIYHMMVSLNQLKWNVTYKGVLVGLFSGLLVALYRFGIEAGVEQSLVLYRYLRAHPIAIAPWVLLIAVVGYFVHRLVQYEPYAKGSGIPQVEGIVLLGMKMKWQSILCVRFIAGIVTAFFGVSLGREGPSIQIGALGSKALTQKFSQSKLEENYLITAGASAGLSAAFNAPLSGIMFALEEVQKSFSPNLLISVTTAALSADVVSKVIFGLKPVLGFSIIPQLPLQHYLLLLPLGVVCGVIGVLVNKSLLGIERFYQHIPTALHPGFALLVALACGIFLPDSLGGGQNLVRMSETAQLGISMAAVYLIVKLFFTSICFGSGIPGGIFMPILSMGALCGTIFGQAVYYMGVSQQFISIFCVCAMAGVMAGSVKSPITSILLMAEMTGSLVHLLPVAVVAFVALLTSDLLNTNPIYEELLERIAPKGAEHPNPKAKGTMIEVAVELGSTIAGKQIKDISWPKGVLVVGLRRGNREVVPYGDTLILQGDYLMVLSQHGDFNEMNALLLELCHAPSV